MIDLDRGKRIVVNADDSLALEDSRGFGGIAWTHREIVTHAEHSKAQIELVRDEMHVVRQRRVARVVESLLVIMDDKTSGIASIAAVGKLA